MRAPTLLLISAFMLIAAPVRAQEPESESWIDSAEAYFATKAEREEWIGLTTRVEKDAFKERYWLKRDPTPGTEQNEFRETILSRIKTANARFPIAKTPGSRTSRGMVFVVFGTPARVREEHAPRLQRPCIPSAGGPPCPPAGLHEGNEVTEVWIYDRDRTPRILEVLGRPSLEVTVIVEPTRRTDRMQNPGLVNQYRELLAERTIVNRDMVPAMRAATPLAPPPRFSPTESVPAAVGAALSTASAQRSATSILGHAALWSEAGTPSLVVWFALPEKRPAEIDGAKMYASISSGEVAQSFVASASHSPLFFTALGGAVAAAQMDLEAGKHPAAFALVDRDGQIMATGATTVQSAAAANQFAVSSVVITGGVNPATANEPSTFRFGNATIAPRADASFLRSESLWYFFGVASPSAPENVTVHAHLRRATSPLAATEPASAQLYQVAPGRFVSGFELPLSELDPGDYTLYVTVTDRASGSEVVRRADFRVLPD